MDGDPAVEPELDAFSLIFPLPYRVAFIFILGIWAWAFNLHYLSESKIDIATLIRHPNRNSASGSSHYLRTYRLASSITIPFVISILLFWIITHRQASLVLAWDILPQSYLFLLVIFFALPLQRLSKVGRYRFLSTLKRISIGGIAEAQDAKFGDVLLSDVLTSYAKVLGDLVVSGCMFFSSDSSSTAKPSRTCGGKFLVPLIISIPSLIRLRQCLIEYSRVRKSIQKTGVNGPSGWGGQHLANALKYSSSFPVIILSAFQRDYDPAKIGMTETGLFRLWLFFVFVNSFYSFYWDVAKDWDLTILSSSRERNSPEHPWGLRRPLQFQSRDLYYAAIITDLFLRCTWSLKLSPHLDHFNDLEGSIFVMEVFEVLRRWIWIFFRVETEWVRYNRGLPNEELPLTDYNEHNNKVKHES